MGMVLKTYHQGVLKRLGEESEMTEVIKYTLLIDSSGDE